MHTGTSGNSRALVLAVGIAIANDAAPNVTTARAQSRERSSDAAQDAGAAPSSAASAAGSSPATGAVDATGTAPTVPAKPAPASGAKPAAPPASPVSPPPASVGTFSTRILSGGSLSVLAVDIEAANLTRLPQREIAWDKPSSDAYGCDPKRSKPGAEFVHAKVPSPENDGVTLLSVPIPRAPCVWPPYQYAHMTVVGEVAGRSRQILFEGTVPVSVWWFPFLLALASIGLIYPGCGLIAWYLALRRFATLSARSGAVATGRAANAPSFWRALDPVQITASAYGRASLAKLQIFVFSLIVFGLLLYYQIRNGVLSGLSKDVLFLLGISAVGTVGGRAAYAAKRRLSLDSWAWLRRHGWFPQPVDGMSCDVASRASWRELIIDLDRKEFDIYSFQMAIFSLVVAAALVTSTLTGLATFEIPPELLGLLGLSQVVFIGGKALETSAYNELDQRLDSLRTHERNYQEAMAKANAAGPNATTNAQAEAEAERKAFKTDVLQAAEIFWALYGEVMPNKPQALGEVDKLEPANH